VTIKYQRGPAHAQSTRRAGRGARGYPSDLTDAQWQVIASYLPPDQPGRRGRPLVWPRRRIVEAILYLDRTGCAWRYLPGDFPPWQTVYGYFAAWRDDGTLTRLHDVLRELVRASAGRNAEPTAAVIDSQSVRAADTVPKASRGRDNAKKVNGRKRHIAVDTTGLVLAVVITAASVQDRDGARPLLWNLHRACGKVLLVWADAGYTARKLAAWATALKITIEIVSKRDQHVFEVLPRRRVVERTFAWISKHRRTVRDYETLPASHEAMILRAMIALMSHRLTEAADLSDTH
jgi:putative transposase